MASINKNQIAVLLRVTLHSLNANIYKYQSVKFPRATVIKNQRGCSERIYDEGEVLVWYAKLQDHKVKVSAGKVGFDTAMALDFLKKQPLTMTGLAIKDGKRGESVTIRTCQIDDIETPRVIDATYTGHREYRFAMEQTRYAQ